MKHFVKIFSVFFVIFSLIFGAAGFYLDAKISASNTEIQIEREKLNLDSKSGPSNEQVVNVLLLGVDSLDQDKTKKSRTDTIMLLSFDKKENKATLISIPRDSMVKIRGRSGFDKVNHAHAYGGVELSIKTIKDLLGVPINHYVKVDYKALFKTVDDLGGVEIDVPRNMKYDDPYADPPLHINLKKGRQVLNGQKSMEFLRFRKGYSNQDIGRIDAQQNFLKALIKKALSPSSVTKVPDYITTMHMYVDTDMKITDMIDLALSAKDINPDEIEKITLKGRAKMINNVSYYDLDKEYIESLQEKLK